MSSHTTPQTPQTRAIDLGIGHPDPDLLPVEMVGSAGCRRLSSGDRLLLQYGIEQGDRNVRAGLAGFLSGHYDRPVSPEELLISGGVSQALDLICTLFAAEGDLVCVEEPTYFLALRIFEDHRLRVRSIPTDADGMNMDALRDAVRTERPAFVYTIPTFQNPSGRTLPQERRDELVDLAASHGFLIVADEVYHLLSYDGAAPPRPLGCHAEGGHVLGLSSFSKILAPGLRVGWIQSAQPLLRRITESGMLDSGGNVNPVGAAIAHEVLASGGLQTHLGRLRGEYARRRDALGDAFTAALQDGLGEAARFNEDETAIGRPSGGYYLWWRLPKSVGLERLQREAAHRDVGFIPGHRFSVSGAGDRYIRLAFCHYPAAELREAAARLGEAIIASAG